MKAKGSCVDVGDKEKTDMIGSGPNFMRDNSKGEGRKTVRGKVSVQIAINKHNVESFYEIKKFQDFEFIVSVSDRRLWVLERSLA